MLKRLVLVALGGGAVLASLGVVRWQAVLAPLLGIVIWMVGTASLASLRTGASHLPDGPPQPVDPATDRITYLCAGCGTEVLLLVRGAATPPRHCGERMHERREVPRLN